MKAIIDSRSPLPAQSRLEDLGFEIILMPRADYLAEPVSAHPDMLIFIGWGKLFCHASYYAKNQSLIGGLCLSGKLTLTLSHEPTGEKYPHDVLFNCVMLGDSLLCNKNTVSRLILAEAEAHQMNVIHTNQGYTKCSVCKVSERAIITSDASIAKACAACGIDALQISEGGVALNGYSCGFIGGATGSDEQNVYFCGDISLHPDQKKIAELCAAHGKRAISLSEEPLYDVGSILFV